MHNIRSINLTEELRKELLDRKLKKIDLFYDDDFINIVYHYHFEWISVDWKGYQSEPSIKNGYTKITEAIEKFKCYQILNDNTNIIGIWTPASKWIGLEWIPKTIDQGIKKIAWVYSTSIMSRISVDESIKHIPDLYLNKVRTFYNVQGAREWLECDKMK